MAGSALCELLSMCLPCLGSVRPLTPDEKERVAKAQANQCAEFAETLREVAKLLEQFGNCPDVFTNLCDGQLPCQQMEPKRQDALIRHYKDNFGRVGESVARSVIQMPKAESADSVGDEE